MPLNSSAAEHCEARFENRRSELRRKRAQQRAYLRGGLIAREDAERRMGPYAYVDTEIEFLNSLADARIECLRAAFKLQGDSLTRPIVEEMLHDLDSLLKLQSESYLASERKEYEDIIWENRRHHAIIASAIG